VIADIGMALNGFRLVPEMLPNSACELEMA